MRIHVDGCWYNERRNTKTGRDLDSSNTLGCTGKTYSKPSSGHGGVRRPGQTHKNLN